jgi:RNA polymerase sigma-70 factor (ECF subfamily)
MTEEQAGLIAACVEGNETAIEQLVHEYQLDVFRLALSVLGDPAEANEVTQDTFMAALRSLKSYQPSSSLKAWLYTIALNFSRSQLRKRKTLERLQRTLTSIFRLRSQYSQTLEETVINRENNAALWEALGRLGEKQRFPVLLRYYHDLSIREIAEILNIKEGTVHSRLSIGREKLRSELADLFHGPGELDNE